jgi:DNA-binding NtrC family response regulator
MGEKRRKESAASILIVEDESPLRRALASLFRANGWRVASTGGWRETRAFVDGRKQPIEILVADVVLPGKSGIVVADRLESRWPNLQTILMSGYSPEVIQRYGKLEAENRSFMAKPLEPDQLLDIVEDLAGATFGE